MKIVLFILLFLLVLLTVLLLYFLITPFRVAVNTDRGTYRVGWSHLANMRLTEENEEWGVRVNLFGWSRRYGLEKLVLDALRSDRKPAKQSGRPLPEKRTGRSKFSIKRVARVMRQVHIREFRLDLDTDDVIANAYLTPVFEGLRFWTRGRYQTRVNFIGRNRLIFQADTRMINLLRAGYL